MKRYGLGWQRDLPDFRDFTPQTTEIKKLLNKSQPLKAAPKAQPKAVDLSTYCSPVEDQEDLGSCTAQAGVGLLEYYENRAHDHFVDASRLFLYKVTRNLLNWTGDTGAYLRTTMKAMVLFGVPPERFWPYVIAAYDVEPGAFLYSFGQSYRSIMYYRLDPPNKAPKDVLASARNFLSAGLPSMFGFTVYNYGNEDGEFAFPSQYDSVLGGHAVVAIGYDDERTIGAEQGALKIRNSWGPDWGEDGYGWLPYRYVTEGLATDFWSLVKADYAESDLFD